MDNQPKLGLGEGQSGENGAGTPLENDSAAGPKGEAENPQKDPTKPDPNCKEETGPDNTLQNDAASSPHTQGGNDQFQNQSTSPNPKDPINVDTSEDTPSQLEASRDKYLSSIEAVFASDIPPSTTTIFGNNINVVARLINLTARLSQMENDSHLYQQAYLAATLLKSKPDSFTTVSMVLDDIDYATSRNSPIYTVMRGLCWSVFLICVGGVFFISISSILYTWSSSSKWSAVITGPYLDFLKTPLIVAATFGMLGSVVSILLRLSEFENATRRSRQFLVMTGVMLPLVGAIFASVTCALFASGIINFSFATGDNSVRTINNPYFYIVIGFLSGFSERFTRGLLGSAENVVASAARTDTQAISTGSATVITTRASKLTTAKGQ